MSSCCTSASGSSSACYCYGICSAAGHAGAACRRALQAHLGGARGTHCQHRGIRRNLLLLLLRLLLNTLLQLLALLLRLLLLGYRRYVDLYGVQLLRQGHPLLHGVMQPVHIDQVHIAPRSGGTASSNRTQRTKVE